MSFYNPWATFSNPQHHRHGPFLPLTASQWAISPFTVCCPVCCPVHCPVPQAALGFVRRCVFLSASGPAFSCLFCPLDPFCLFLSSYCSSSLRSVTQMSLCQEACMILLQDEVSGCCWVSWQRVLLHFIALITRVAMSLIGLCCVMTVSSIGHWLGRQRTCCLACLVSLAPRTRPVTVWSWANYLAACKILLAKLTVLRIQWKHSSHN